MLIRHIFLVVAFVLFIPSQVFWLGQVRGLGGSGTLHCSAGIQFLLANTQS